jgi:hypothetical protein
MPRGQLLIPVNKICSECSDIFFALHGRQIFCLKCKPRARYARYALKIKERVYTQYGNRCKQCGFDDRRAMQLDHVRGGGSKERKEKRWSNASVYSDALKNPEKYQLLCANCNAIKRYENGEIPNNVHYKQTAN